MTPSAPTRVSVDISSGDTTEVKIRLGATVTLETVIVEGKRLPPTVSRTEIRGSKPGSNLYYLDRTPLGYPFHWGGLLSTVSSETLEKIDIYAGGWLHLRSNFTENLTSNFSLTRSHNFLNIDFQAVTGEEYTIVEGRVEPSSYAANYFHYQIKVNAPVYMLREDVTYRLNPQLQLESGFLYAFNPAKSSENSRIEENFESDKALAGL